MAIQSEYSYIDENRDAIIDILKKQGLNLVPIPKGRGKRLGESWDKWQMEQYNEEFSKEYDFAVMGGVTSDGVAIIDFEIRNLSDELRDKILLPIMDEIFPNAINETLVVKTGNGYHIYIKTKDHVLQSKDFKKDGVTVEIKGQKKYVIGPSSRHYDLDETGEYFLSGKVYKIISNVTQIKTVSAVDFINNLLSKGWNGGTQNKPVSELYNDISKKGVGSNRQGDFIRILSSLKIKNPEFDFDDLKHHGYKINSQFKDSYPQKITDEKIKVSWNFANDILQNRTNEILEKNKVFSKLWNEHPENDKINKNAHALVKICIKSGLMVVKSDIRKKLNEWCNLHKVIPLMDKNQGNAISKIVNSVFSDSKTVGAILKICHDLGSMKKPITFDQDQTMEVGEWIKGRYHIKRIELSDDLVIFNERYYEKTAEESIKRYARSCLVKSTNNSINEVWGYVKQTSDIIDNDEVQKHVHLKCLENGIYNIKTGEFSTEFDPDYIILNYIPHKFEERDYEEIEKRVKEIISNDEDRQTFYDALSNSMHPYTGIDFQLGIISMPGTGKTQLAKLIKMLLGAKNMSFATIHKISSDPTVQRDVAYNFLNIDDDLSSDDLRFIDILKRWITQDDFSGRSIYAHTSTYRPTTRLMFMGNGLYEITNPDDAEAIYERTHLIKLHTKFRHTDKEEINIFERIENLDQELLGLITYLLKNATWIYENKKIHHRQKTSVTRSMWNEYGNNLKNFIESYIETGARFKCPNAEVLNKWMGYCLDKKIQPRGKNTFYEKFNEIMGNSPTKIWISKDESYYGYYGFRIREYPLNALDLPLKEKILQRIKELSESDPIFEKINGVLSC